MIAERDTKLLAGEFLLTNPSCNYRQKYLQLCAKYLIFFHWQKFESPTAFAEYVAAEAKRWAKIAKESNATAD